MATATAQSSLGGLWSESFNCVRLMIRVAPMARGDDFGHVRGDGAGDDFPTGYARARSLLL
jgi:hypothetical protein